MSAGARAASSSRRLRHPATAPALALALLAAPATARGIDYDVVYVRCPRATEPVTLPSSSDETTFEAANWNGVNDQWISATNTVLQQPGCDLAVRRADGTDEILVDCDEDTSGPVCSVVDPNVSFDGRYVVYAKFTDATRFGEGSGRSAWVRLSETPDSSGVYARASPSYRARGPAADAPALIFIYDLARGVETQVSPDPRLFAGTVHGEGPDWTRDVAVLDLGPFFLADGRIGFTSNRDSGWSRFHLFAMDPDGRNLERIGHRALGDQLHPAILMDGRIVYTSRESSVQRVGNNNFSLFTVNPDGSDAFVMHGQHEPTSVSYHFTTQLSNGDIAVGAYYNRNNNGMGTIHVFPVDPDGPDFVHMRRGLITGRITDAVPFEPDSPPIYMGITGSNLLPFWRPGLYNVGLFASNGDTQTPLLSDEARWLHPGDGREIVTGAKLGHPAAAPDQGLLATLSIGGSSRVVSGAENRAGLETLRRQIGFDGGIWLMSGAGPIDHPRDLELVVDTPEYHEIMPRALVPYRSIYGIDRPAVIPRTSNVVSSARNTPGAPYGFTGTASMIERETHSFNGTAWNRIDGGGTHAGRGYLGLVVQGADLAYYDDDEIFGVRVVLPQLTQPMPASRRYREYRAGLQRIDLRILGEWPVRRRGADGAALIDASGNQDTSFLARIPADTPFFLQAIDENGMALSLEMTGRSVTPGEMQTCSGCHLHTRDGIPFEETPAFVDPDPIDFTVPSAPLVVERDAPPAPARELFEGLVDGVDRRVSFGANWSDVGPVLERRCGSGECHGGGSPARGLLLDASRETYERLVRDRRSACCTASRWVGMNSARMSMLVWAMYNRRLDGRPNDTSVDESNEVWDVDHPSIAGLTSPERHLIQRWIDLGASGAPEGERTDDMRPVLTVTPLLEEAGVVRRLLIGLWDDSGVDYRTLSVTANERLGGVAAGENLLEPGAEGDVVELTLPEAIGPETPASLELTFEVFDRAWPAPEGRANRTRKVFSSRGLLERAGVEVERALPDGGLRPPGDADAGPGLDGAGAEGCACRIGPPRRSRARLLLLLLLLVAARARARARRSVTTTIAESAHPNRPAALRTTTTQACHPPDESA